MTNKKLKIVYLTPSLYIAGGVERVLTLKANYFAEHFDYDITIILTDGKDRPFFYPLSPKVKVIQLDINFEQLWSLSFLRKIPVYLYKQRLYRRKVGETLMQLRPDITVSLLRREINFLCDIKDGSKKVGELHITRGNYRNFNDRDTNWAKQLFAKYWMRGLVRQLRRLDRFVVLTHEDARSWTELSNVEVIPDPLSFWTETVSPLTSKRVIAVGRYSYEKGFDLLLKAWAKVAAKTTDWQLEVFGSGNREPYLVQMKQLGIDPSRCRLNGATNNISEEYLKSSVMVFSSRFEGFGMALVEAMACGLPVVSFACPCGPKDIVTDGVNGLLADPEDVEQLADKLLLLTADEALRRRLAANAVKRSHDYDLPQLSLKWKNLFESL